MNIGNEVDVAWKRSTRFLHWFRPGLIVVEESFKLAGQQLGKAILGQISSRTSESLQTDRLGGWSHPNPAGSG